jgi:hypothetical protein
MWRIMEETNMDVHFQRNRHAFQAIYWFLRCTFGKDNENFLPVRAFFRFLNSYHNRRIKVLEYVEATANLVIGKDMILYGRKRAASDGAQPREAATAAVGADA